MVNAIGNLPIFSDLTQHLTKETRNYVFRVAVLTGGSIVLGFALFGDFMLKNVFEIDAASFKIAGGILVFVVSARGVIIGNKTSTITASDERSIAIFPLGFPYLAGPGTILTTILLFKDNEIIITITSAVLVYLTILPLLRLAPLVTKVFGQLGVSVISRILYIFIGAKAVSFILDGIRSFVTSL